MVKAKIDRSIKFVEKDIWAPRADLHPVLKVLYGIIRLFYMTIEGFLADFCLIRATALAYTTMLSIVPLLAVAFSILKGFGFQNSDFIRDLLLNVTAGRAEVVEYILTYINNTNVKTLGWIGVAALMLTVFSLFSSVERAFNNIWDDVKSRAVWRRFTDFFSVMLICPILLVVSVSVTVTIEKTAIMQYLLAMQGVGVVWAMLLKLVPFLVLAFAFTFMYAYIPNTKVRVDSAAVGGFIAAFMWQSAQWGYINWQVGFKKYNAIYGSFAQLPLFLVWLYISWTILLFGAEICYAWQHMKVFTRKRSMGRFSDLERQQTAVILAMMLTRHFYDVGGARTADTLAEEIGLPPEVVVRELEELVGAGCVLRSEVEGKSMSQSYALAFDPEKIHIGDILSYISDPEREGGLNLPENLEFFGEQFTSLMESVQESPHNLTLAELAKRLPESE
ncbi:MAG: YhjD/YihY/BrkB family envelope integrity protein [Desulfovibrio sp.]